MKKITEEQDEPYQHAIRQYLLQCANHVIALAPLPEFKEVIGSLEFYDQEPTKRNREKLKKIYRDLRRGRKSWRRDYGRSALSEIYYGLCGTLQIVLHRQNYFTTGGGFRFTEARYLATENVTVNLGLVSMDPYLPEKAQNMEHDWQHEVWLKTLGEYHEKYDIKESVKTEKVLTAA